MRWRNRWSSWQTVLVFTAASLAQQWRLLLGRVPLSSDIVTSRALFRNVSGVPHRVGAHSDLNDLAKFFYPFRASSGRALHEGTLAVWNARILEGAPFLADLISGVLYPPNTVLYALLPASVAWSVGFVLRPVLAGCFTVLLARTLGASRTGALVAGSAFAFSGFMVGWMGAPQSDVAVWLPLALYAAHRVTTTPRLTTLAGASVCFALPVLAGHPEAALFGTAATTAFALHRVVFRDEDGPSRRIAVGAFVLAGLLAAGIAAIQILPALEWIGHLDRYEAHAAVPPLPVHDVLSFVSRDAQGDPNSLGLDVSGAASYVGLLTLVCAPLALLHRNRRDVIFFAVLAAIAAQVAYGLGPLFWLSQHLPVVHSVANAMVVGVLDLSIALLAALGITVAQRAHLRAALEARVVSIVGASVAAVGLVLGVAVWYPRHHPHSATTDWFRGPFVSAVLILVAGALCAVTAMRRAPKVVTSALFVAVALIDSTSYAYGHIPFFRSDQLYPAAPAFDALRARDDSTYRIAGLDGAYTPNLEMMYGFDSASGYDFPTSDAARLLSPLGVKVISYELSAANVVATRDRRLDLMNVKYLFTASTSQAERLLRSEPDRFASVIDDGAVDVFENKHVLPRAFLVPYAGFKQVPDAASGFAALADPGFDPSKRAIIVSPDTIAAPGPETAVSMPAVEDLRVDDTEVTMTVDAPVDAIAVLSESIYPGWSVEVDGKSSELLRTDAMFQGVAVPAGRHTVRFAFQSDSVKRGAIVSTASLMVLAGLLLTALLRRRRTQ